MLSNIWVYKKTSKVMISLLLAAVLVLATQNWLLGLLMFIVTAAAVVWVKRSDLMQERLLMRYLDDLSSGVSVGTVYAVRNLPLGIAVVDEKKKARLGKRRISFMDCRYGRGNASPGYYPGTESSQALGEGGVV